MHAYSTIKNLNALRLCSKVFPLKHKLSFLIKKYLNDGSGLAIRYYNNWHVCTVVNAMNRSTIEEVILEGTASQPELALIKKMRNALPDKMVMIDVGGNIGTFLGQFVDKCDTIFAFEPIPRLNQVIKESIEYNKDKKVKLIAKAVGDAPSVVKMFDNNNSSIVSEGGQEAVLEIEVITLDSELTELKRIDFIKIDVEGYELNVLNGAKKIIEKHRPAILVEVHPVYLANYNQHHTDVISFFEKNNYKITYYSFLEEWRMPRWKRIISRWGGNKGVHFAGKQDFLNDVDKEPKLTSYHFYCEPL